MSPRGGRMELKVYDANSSYEENYAAGPRAEFNASGVLPRLRYLGDPCYRFLGVPVHVPFGMPAGPLLNARYVRTALGAGFCLPTYKTVRSRAHASHPWPNVFSIASEGPLFVRRGEPLATVSARALEPGDYARGAALSISNSFGVPSRVPLEWSEDLFSLAGTESPGQAVVVSFQGTQPEGLSGEAAARAFTADNVEAACLALDASVRAFPHRPALLEINMSCPNEKGAPIYRDVARSVEILEAVRAGIDARASELGAPRAKLVAKIGVLPDPDVLAFVRGTRGVLNAVSAINTVSARILSPEGRVVLGAGVESGGVCGNVIFPQALRMVEKLAAARRAERLDREEYAILAVGGAGGVAQFRSFLGAGADAVQSATGAMWNLELASEIARSLAVPFEVLSQ